MMLSYALTFIDPIRGVALQSRALLLALRARELERIVRAVSIEAAFSGHTGGRAAHRTARLLSYASELAARSGSIESRVFAGLARASCLFLNGRYQEAAPAYEAVLVQLEDGSTGLVHEQMTSRLFLTVSLAGLGRLKELRRLQPAWLRDAIARGELYGSVMMRTGLANLAWLIDDRPAVAEAQTTAALADWSKEGFDAVHYYSRVAQTLVALYRDDGAQAASIARELHQRASRSRLWRSQLIRVRVFYLLSFTALHLAASAASESADLLQRADWGARVLRRERMPSHLPFATVVEAGLALRSGARDDALRGLDEAVSEFSAQGMLGYANAVRDRAARLRGDDSSAADIDRASAFFRAEGVVNPARFIAMLVPGFVPAHP